MRSLCMGAVAHGKYKSRSSVSTIDRDHSIGGLSTRNHLHFRAGSDIHDCWLTRGIAQQRASAFPRAVFIHIACWCGNSGESLHQAPEPAPSLAGAAVSASQGAAGD